MKYIKKISLIMLALCLVISYSACAKDNEKESDSSLNQSETEKETEIETVPKLPEDEISKLSVEKLIEYAKARTLGLFSYASEVKFSFKLNSADKVISDFNTEISERNSGLNFRSPGQKSPMNSIKTEKSSGIKNSSEFFSEIERRIVDEVVYNYIKNNDGEIKLKMSLENPLSGVTSDINYPYGINIPDLFSKLEKQDTDKGFTIVCNEIKDAGSKKIASYLLKSVDYTLIGSDIKINSASAKLHLTNEGVPCGCDLEFEIERTNSEDVKENIKVKYESKFEVDNHVTAVKAPEDSDKYNKIEEETKPETEKTEIKYIDMGIFSKGSDGKLNLTNKGSLSDSEIETVKNILKKSTFEEKALVMVGDNIITFTIAYGDSMSIILYNRENGNMTVTDEKNISTTISETDRLAFEEIIKNFK